MVTVMIPTRLFLLVLAIALTAVEARALTAEEVVLLKQNGVSEETIQRMLASEQAASRTEAHGERAGIRTIERPGGRKAIVYSTGSGDHAARQAAERLKEARAWEMLRHLIVDTRSAPAEASGSAD